MPAASRRLALLSLLALAGVSVAACDGGGEGEEGAGGAGGGEACPLGGPGAEPELLELKQVKGDGTVEVLADGGTVDLVRPVQGGHVIFVGARVTGMCGENVTIRGRVRSTVDGRVLAEDRRTQIDLVDQGDGSAEPAWDRLAEVANVPLCPDFLGNQVAGAAWDLELTVTDQAGLSATKRVRVTPTCAQPAGAERELCQCECAADYEFGKCDGGEQP